MMGGARSSLDVQPHDALVCKPIVEAWMVNHSHHGEQRDVFSSHSPVTPSGDHMMKKLSDQPIMWMGTPPDTS